MLDFGVAPGLLYLVTELVVGPSIAKVVERDGALAPSRAVHVAVQICDALDAAHHLGIAHRNVQPRKVRVFDNPPWHDSVKILGFGFTGSLSVAGDGSTEVVTTHYTPPERVLGQAYDARSDLYSVGAIIYEMLSGRPPFAHVTNDLELLKAHAYSVAPRLPPTIPERLAAVVAALLAKKPEDRPQTAVLTREALLSAMGTAPLAFEDGDTSGLALPTLRESDVVRPSGELAHALEATGLTADNGPAEGAVNWDDATGSLLLDPDVEAKLNSPAPSAADVVFRSASHHALPEMLVGTVLDDRYELLELIGQGGFGQVYRGRQATVERDIAVKVISRTLIHDEEAAKRFEREARLSGKLNHPHVVHTIAFGCTKDGLYYLVMEFVKGRTLKEILAEERRFEVRRAAHIVAQICDALEAAHTMDIIHRDLKPSNVMVADDTAGDFVKILDYGLAKSLGDDTALTRHNSIFGSPAYMPPEMVLNRKYDRRGDMYSVGIVAYEMLVGHTPFASADNLFDLMRAHAYEAPPPLPAHVPPAMRQLISTLLAKSPDERYATIADLRAALSRCPGMEPLSSPSLRMLSPHRFRPSSGSIPALSTVKERPPESTEKMALSAAEIMAQTDEDDPTMLSTQRMAGSNPPPDSHTAPTKPPDDLPPDMVLVAGEQQPRSSLFDPSEAETNVAGSLPKSHEIMAMPKIISETVEPVPFVPPQSAAPTERVSPSAFAPEAMVATMPSAEDDEDSSPPTVRASPPTARKGVPLILVLLLMGLMLGMGIAVDRYMSAGAKVIEAPRAP